MQRATGHNTGTARPYDQKQIASSAKQVRKTDSLGPAAQNKKQVPDHTLKQQTIAHSTSQHHSNLDRYEQQSASGLLEHRVMLQHNAIGASPQSNAA